MEQLSLKGLDFASIAKLRNAAPGTVRAQFKRVYAKSGVSNRAQFVLVYWEELMGDREVIDKGSVQRFD